MGKDYPRGVVLDSIFYNLAGMDRNTLQRAFKEVLGVNNLVSAV